MDKLETLSILADHTRYKILQLIIKESQFCDHKDSKPYKGNCLTELQKKVNVSKSTLSHHLKLLEEHKLIKKEKKGKWTYIFPNTSLIQNVFDMTLEDLLVKKNIQPIEFSLEKKLSSAKFEELISLIENHGVAKIYKNNSKNILKNPNDVLVEIENTENNIKVHSTDEMNALVHKLIERYLPTLTSI